VFVSDIPALRDFWYPVAYAADVDASPVACRLMSTDVVVWRGSRQGPLLAALDRCPHRAARPSQGWVDSGCLVCPYHGWKFDEMGRCVEVPAHGPDAPIPPSAVLSTVAVAERYGLVWVCVGDPCEPLPTLDEAEPTSGYTLIHELMELWPASAPRVMDNALDVSHIPWVHRNTVGTPDHPRVSPFSVERDGLRLRFTLSYTAAMSEQQKINTGITTDTAERKTHVELVSPFVYRGVLEYPANGLRHVLFKTATPVDDDTTLFCQFIARNDNPPPERWEAIADVDRSVQAEDRALLAGVPSQFPLDTTTEVHVAADRMTVEYRRVLADLARR
jgi:phenylpropionate dioxygenase-like ring-hydroxylating dioxygenase large terminal subunit